MVEDPVIMERIANIRVESPGETARWADRILKVLGVSDEAPFEEND
jgi:hypothetical protein